NPEKGEQMKILVTGASGLLGAELVKQLSPDHEVTGTYGRNAVEGLVHLDLENPDSIDSLIDNGGFTHIINSAAQRSPDYCINNVEEAYRVNSAAVEYLARAANRNGAVLIQISTDYVFPGTGAPYKEDDLPRPINVYGRAKLAGEFAAKSAEQHMVVRIPALYNTDFDNASNAATEIALWLRKDQIKTVDAETIRYYTLVDDIAAAVKFLIERDCRGTYQLSAEQQTTKAGFARMVAKHLGLGDWQVVDAPAPIDGAIRPIDSHFDTSKYLSLGGPGFKTIDEALGL
ncbi:MAG: SDR family oxidoreductase, partial [Planctomycetes bacterium]|nr:SDR family oxidoreductase [Planctomycetota bacterium]